MRGIETPITKLRRQVFTEVAKVAFDSKNLNDDIEAIPYKIARRCSPLQGEHLQRARYRSREGKACDGAFSPPGE